VIWGTGEQYSSDGPVRLQSEMSARYSSELIPIYVFDFVLFSRVYGCAQIEDILEESVPSCSDMRRAVHV